MLKPLNFIALLVLAYALSSCAYYREGIDLSRPVNTSALKIGMTKPEVEQIINKKYYKKVAAQNYPERNTEVEVLEYSQEDTEKTVDSYWLYFVNGKLDRWERANPHGRPLI